MNDNDSLSLEGNALIQFFNEEELIIKAEETAPIKKEPESIIANENHASIVFEGKNLNGLIMLFNHPGETNIQASDRPLLERLVENKAALNKSLEEACSINLHHQKIQWQEIIDQLNPKQVICWDILPEGITSMEKNKAEQIDGVLVILSDSVLTLEKNPSLKVPLWNELKAKFI